MGEDSTEWQTTVNHDLIRDWAAVREAVPVVVEESGGRAELRIETEDDAGGERLSWERFFELFESERLAFRYRERKSQGELQEEYELVRRDSHEREIAEDKTTEPRAVESDELVTSDTGDSEPAIYDRVESGQSDADDVEGAATSTPMSESARGSVDAAEAIVLDEIHESAVGPDEWQGSDEYVVLENAGEVPVDLSGCVVENEIGQSYQFSEDTVLQPGEQVVLHSGAGEDTDEHRYWNAEASVWRDQGDTVLVKTAAGERILSETYKGGR